VSAYKVDQLPEDLRISWQNFGVVELLERLNLARVYATTTLLLSYIT